jgi:hypothetical protein
LCVLVREVKKVQSKKAVSASGDQTCGAEGEPSPKKAKVEEPETTTVKKVCDEWLIS